MAFSSACFFLDYRAPDSLVAVSIDKVSVLCQIQSITRRILIIRFHIPDSVQETEIIK